MRLCSSVINDKSDDTGEGLEKLNTLLHEGVCFGSTNRVTFFNQIKRRVN